MDDIREQVVANLSQQGILRSLKAQLRAAVFAAIQGNEDHGLSLRCDRRDWLLSTEEGISMAALVREFLVWSELTSTVKVFDAETEVSQELGTREDLAQHLCLNDHRDQPLLLSILQSFLQQQPDPQERVTHLQFGNFSSGELDGVRMGDPAILHSVSAASQGGDETSLIKAVHVQAIKQSTASPTDNFEDAESELSFGAGPSADTRKPPERLAGLLPASETSPPLRSHLTRITDLEEISPTRKSVEELKRQLQSQGLLLSAANSSPERLNSARSARSA